MTSSYEQMLGDGEVTPAFLNEQEKALFATFVMGEEAIRFLNSDLGRLFIGTAKERRQVIERQLATAPLTDIEAIRKLQFDHAVASQFLRFLVEALRDGEAAYQQLQQSKTEG